MTHSDNCPTVGMGPLLQFPHPPRAGPVLLTLLFFTLVASSYQVLHGSIYSFPLVRYSCRSQLVFCMHFCVWRCIPDVCVERDVLHAHLLFHHLVPNWCFWTVVLEKTLESPLDCKEIQPVNPEGNQSWKDWCWSWNSNTLVTWCEELTHWKRPWSWERLKAGGEGDDRGWDGWMASPTQWTWVFVSSRSWWWTGKPDILQSMGSQRVGHEWATELSWGRTNFQTQVFSQVAYYFFCWFFFSVRSSSSYIFILMFSTTE